MQLGLRVYHLPLRVYSLGIYIYIYISCRPLFWSRKKIEIEILLTIVSQVPWFQIVVWNSLVLMMVLDFKLSRISIMNNKRKYNLLSSMLLK